ncbi:MAG: TPM domain-containing protein [Leptospirales bacterium]|nr:TPM domain-containing protein [Leptospirales bacterium]
MRKFLLILALQFWIVGQLVAREVPPLSGRIVDLAGALSPATIHSVEQRLADHERETGNQIAILIVPSLEGDPIEDYSIRVAEQWRLGTAKNDNGILFLISTGDRRMRIEVGQGLEGALTDAQASRIIRETVAPLFREGRMDDGVVAGVEKIMAAVAGEYVADPGDRSESSSEDALDASQLPFAFIVSLALAFVAWLMLRHALWSRSTMSWPFFFPLNGVFSLLLVGPTLLVRGAVLASFGAAIAVGFFALLIFYKLRWQRSGRPHPEAEKVIVGGILDIGLQILLRSGRRSSWSSGGGFSGGGGGFSGGGGGFSGGGASGSW